MADEPHQESARDDRRPRTRSPEARRSPAGRPAPSIVRTRFDDIEAFSEAARGWNIAFRQLDRGRLCAEIDQVHDDGMLITSARVDRLIDQTGAPPTGTRTFAIADAVRHWCGFDGGSDSILSFRPDGEYRALSEPGFDVHTISISGARLAEAAAALGVQQLDALLGAEASVIKCTGTALAALKRDLHTLSRIEEPRLDDLDACRSFHEICTRIPERLVAAIAGSQLEQRRPPASIRRRALRAALELVDESAAEPPSLQDVIHAAGVGERTLQYAFREHFGIGPKAYLQAVRLNGVHRSLRRGAIPVKVADVANAWGFWHMGQFAADYRRHFGELPSETLARRRLR